MARILSEEIRTDPGLYRSSLVMRIVAKHLAACADEVEEAACISVPTSYQRGDAAGRTPEQVVGILRTKFGQVADNA